MSTKNDTEAAPAPKMDGGPRLETQDETAEKENAPGLVGPDGEALKSELPEEHDWTKTKFPVELFGTLVALKRDDREEFSASGTIKLPPGSQPRSMTGTVVAVGPGMMKGDGSYVPLAGLPPVKVGDRVVFEKMRAMIEVYVEGRAYHLLRDNDLVGRVCGSSRIASERI